MTDAVEHRGDLSSRNSGGSGVAPGRAERRLAYQPALDGIRGLAVAAVLAYHAGLPWARGGFLGVDAFFVLSGYLITSLLLAEWRATGSIGLVAFWTRRARRLLPALFLVLAGVACYAAVFAEAEELSRLREDALATLGYVANWRPVFSGESYFEQFSVPSPLRHTWSLAIEEQWYIVWPLLVIVLLRVRRGSAGALLGAALVMAAGSALLMAWLHDPGTDPSRVYYGTDTRAQSLLAGAVLAVLMLQRRPALGNRAWLLLEIAGLACAAYIGWMWVTTSDDSFFLYHGGFLALALAVTVVIVAAVRPGGGLVATILSAPPLRGLGLISYGVYLWHWPVYLVLTPERTAWDGYPLFALRVLATLAIALASYLLLETPFRRGAFRGWRASWLLAPAAAAVLVIGLVLVTRGGEPTFAISDSAPPPTPPTTSTLLSETRGATSQPPVRVLVVGDSVAFTMAMGLTRAESAWNLSVWNMGRLGCGVLRADALLARGKWVKQDGSCNDWPARWQSYVDAFQPDVVAVLAGAWDLYDRQVEGRVLAFGTPEADAFILAELEAGVDVLSSRGAKVMFLTTPYYQERDLALGVGAPRFDAGRIDRLNSLYERVARRRGDVVSVLDLNGLVARAGTASVELQSDGVHFTAEGADFIARWLAPELSRAGRRVAASAAGPAPAGDGEDRDMPPARWLELLGRVPDTGETRSLTVMNDYARFRAAFGVPLPGPDAEEGDLFEYYRRLLFSEDGRPTALVPAKGTGIAEFPPALTESRTQFGFTIADIDQDVWGGEGGAVQVLRGRFDATAVPASMGGDRFAADGAFMYRSATDEGLEAMLDAAAGERETLAGAADFHLLARGLDRLDTYTALFSTDLAPYSVPELAKRIAGTDADAERVAATRRALQRETMLLPYQAFAAGAGIDGEGSYTALVLLNADAETAGANARRLQARIDEGTSWIGGQAFRDLIDDSDIVRDGRLVIAKLRTDEYLLWFALHAARDTLLLHE